MTTPLSGTVYHR